jgi:hypothetical protein
MPFNSVVSDLVNAYPGQLAEPLAPKFARSVVVETAIKAGRLAKRGTDKDDQISPVTTGDTVIPANLAGIVLLSTSRPYEQTDGGSGIEAGNSASVLRLGSVYLAFAEAVTAGEDVAIVLADGTFKGYAAGTAAGSIPTGEVIVPGLRIAQTTAAAGCAIVEVNLFGLQDAATIGSA